VSWRFASVLLLPCLLLGGAAAEAGAQPHPYDEPRPQFWGPWPEPPPPRRTTQAQLLTLGANALLGGVTAAVRQYRGDGSIAAAFAGGALGGAVAFAGKRIAGEEFTASGLLGREVAAVGASITSNAAEGRGLMDTLMLPVGPVRIHVDRSAPRVVSPRLDLGGAIATVYIASQSAGVDWRATFDAGAPVFRMKDRTTLSAGRATAGVIQLRHDARRIDGALPHEQVHVAQHDFAYMAWGRPMDRHVLGGSGAGAAILRYVDVGLHVPLLGILNSVLPYDSRPWEWEAEILSNTRGCC
jgi:hypothetical protein